MVIHYKFLQFCALVFCLALFQPLISKEGPSDNVTVGAEIDLYQAYEGRPLKGTLSVSHNASEKIDESSFKLENAPLKAEPLKVVKFSPGSDYEMSMYQFTIPGKTQGLYVLPSVSVKVGDYTYYSIASSYEVKSENAPSYSYQIRNAPQNIVPNEPPVAVPSTSSSPGPLPPSSATLQLKASVDGLNPMYPGQEVWFTYKFYYSGNIKLSKEELPLLDAEGFVKVGDVRTREYSENGMSVTEISQQVKAVKPGTYLFPASYAIGYASVVNAMGVDTLIEPPIRSDTQAVSVTVNPFPPGQPPSFKGAIGLFTISTSLLSPAQTSVDDEMKLAIDISGTGELSAVSMPDLAEAGFKQLFRLNDLPSIGEINGNTKRFIVILGPLSTTVKQIPSVPFSYFDPLAGVYGTVNSNPIPISVTANKTQEAPTAPVIPQQPILPPPQTIPTPPVVQQPQQPAPPQVPQEITSPTESNVPQKYTPGAVEIAGNLPMTKSDLRNLLFGTWWSLLLIPFGILLVLFQIGLKKYLNERKNIVHPKTSDDYFQDAISAGIKSPKFYQALNQAFLLRLKEKGLITNAKIAHESLPKSGITGEVRNFLSSIEEKRFTGDKVLSDDTLIEAKTLFKKIGT